MKKVLCLVLALALVFALSACGAAKQLNDTKNEIQDAVNEIQSNISDIASNMPDDGKFDTVQEFVDFTVKTEIFKQSIDTTAAQGMDLKLIARGDDLVYQYYYTVEVADNAAEILEQQCELNATVFKTSADTVRLRMPIVDKVIWEYYTQGGKLIYAYEA